MSRRNLFETIKYEEKGAVGLITLNQPKKLNAMSQITYGEFPKALEAAAQNDDIKILAIIGEGKFYTSGNDISAMATAMAESDLSPEELAQESNQRFQDFVDAIIDFKKPIAALVNGPAIGIGVTHLPLCDFVWASDAAYFVTPFTRLGLTPEGCSSYTFPKILGPSMANEMLMTNAKFTAQDMKAAGLVSAIYPNGEFRDIALKRVEEISQLPPQSVQLSKSLIRNETEREKLHSVNAAECEILGTRYQSEELINATMQFMMSKQK